MLEFLQNSAKNGDLYFLIIVGRRGEIGKIYFDDSQQKWEVFVDRLHLGTENSFPQAAAVLEEYDYNFI